MRVLLLVLAVLLAFAPAHAQTLQGRVVKGGRGLPGIPVELHRVTSDTAGRLSAGVTGAGGEFSFPLPPAGGPGFVVLFATADFQGVRYFGGPLHSSEATAGYTVEVFDTLHATTATAGVRVARRDVILLPEEDGSAEVNEIVQLHNPRGRTVVAAPGESLWTLRLPKGVGAFEVGEGRIAPEAVRRVGERIFLTGSLVPGTHELFLRYRLPRGAARTALPLAPGTDTVNLFVRQPSAEVRVAGLPAPAVVRADRESFLRFTGAGLGGKPELVMEWERGTPPPVDPRAAAAGVTGLLLVAGAVLAARRGARGRSA